MACFTLCQAWAVARSRSHADEPNFRSTSCASNFYRRSLKFDQRTYRHSFNVTKTLNFRSWRVRCRSELSVPLKTVLESVETTPTLQNSTPLRLGVLISGGGRSLENLCERINSNRLRASIEVVVSSKEGVYGLTRASQHGLKSDIVSRKSFKSAEEFSDAITSILIEHDVDLVVLAGFLNLYNVPKAFENRVINIHPSLIPAYCGKGFYGHHVHEAVIAAKEKVSGCTVHLCDNEYDNGPILVQKTVPVLPDDTPDTLADRVFEAEKEALPEAIQLFADDKIRVNGRTVEFLS
mmetsp:Transcript_45765/g.74664  ORF Transcript_45765/g.74664 Transcript_45765/m.74664 type:complete len:294 (+) Transcript_45765:23-904(+)